MQRPKIYPPAYLAVCVVLMGALHFLLPIAVFLQPPLSLIGIVPIIGGIAMSAMGAGMFKRAGTPVVPFEHSTALVTTGLYRFTRNPMYLGLVVVLIGVAIVCGTVGPLIPIPIFIWIIITSFIIPEEKFLEEIFGERYLAYKKSVRRWL